MTTERYDFAGVLGVTFGGSFAVKTESPARLAFHDNLGRCSRDTFSANFADRNGEIDISAFQCFGKSFCFCGRHAVCFHVLFSLRFDVHAHFGLVGPIWKRQSLLKHKNMILQNTKRGLPTGNPRLVFEFYIFLNI